MEESVVETHEEWASRKLRERMHVTRYQAKAALYDAGLLSSAESVITASTDPLVKLAWQEAGFIRQSAFVDSVGAELGLSALQLDDLFIAAAKIK